MEFTRARVCDILATTVKREDSGVKGTETRTRSSHHMEKARLKPTTQATELEPQACWELREMSKGKPRARTQAHSQEYRGQPHLIDVHSWDGGSRHGRVAG